MSHTATIKLNITDKKIIKKAAESLHLPVKEGEFELYSSVEKGIGVFLPGWRYPIVIKEDGTVAYDNFNGTWGREEELTKFKNRYTLEKTKAEAKKQGYHVTEKKLEGKTRLILKKY